MKKTIAFVVAFILLISIVLHLLDVVTNRYIIISTYFACALFVAVAHIVSWSEKK